MDDGDVEDEVPPLELPRSSDDLLLPNDLVLPALSVYEVCGVKTIYSTVFTEFVV